MPDKHKQFTQWNAERFLAWAQKVGPSTTAVIKGILSFHRVEQQGYKSCMAVLKLADRYSLVRLEAACTKALSYTPNPSYKNVSTILKSGQDTVVVEQNTSANKQHDDSQNDYGFTRGAGYYGRNHNA